MEIFEKKIEIMEKIKSAGINPEDLKKSLNVILDSTSELDVQPIETVNITTIDIVEPSEEDESEDE